MKRSERSRSGFTLVELLVVIGILLILAGFALAIFSTGKSSDRMRSGARIAQSAFLGAKDRALHAKDLRGVRLTRDQTNANLINGFVYLQALASQSTGMPGISDLAVLRPGAPTTTDATQVQITGAIATTWHNQDANRLWPVPPGLMLIRIPSGTGQWYALQKQNSSAPYWGTYTAPSGGNPASLTLTLQTPYIGGKAPVAPTYNAIDPADASASCDIKLGNDVMPFHQPITLPSACVIDVNWCSSNVQSLAGGILPVPLVNPAPNIDIMFSPRGMVSGPLGAQGPLHLCIRDIQDATAGLSPSNSNVKGDCLILTVFPQTGLVQTFPANLTDADNDGAPDNLFSFAQTGQSAGQ